MECFTVIKKKYRRENSAKQILKIRKAKCWLAAGHQHTSEHRAELRG